MSDESDARERADYHVRKQQERRARESAKAQELLDEFVRTALDQGLPTTELTAKTWKGKGRYATGVRGWYLRLDQSLGGDPHLRAPPRGGGAPPPRPLLLPARATAAARVVPGRRGGTQRPAASSRRGCPRR